MKKAGQRLKEARLSKGLTIEEVAQSTKIKASFLVALEEGDYGFLPSASYAQGFVKNYAKFLGLSEKEVLAVFKREFDGDNIYKVLPRNFEQRKEMSFSGIRTKQTGILIVFIFIILSGYIFFQYRAFLFDPSLSVSKPLNNSKVLSTDVEVIGKTDSDSVVFINDYPVSPDDNGNFKKTISVFPGKNEIDIKSVNKFNRQAEIKREIDVEPNP